MSGSRLKAAIGAAVLALTVSSAELKQSFTVR